MCSAAVGGMGEDVADTWLEEDRATCRCLPSNRVMFCVAFLQQRNGIMYGVVW